MARRKKHRSASLVRRLTASRRVLPRVICIGAQRCGTTTFMRHLLQHPDFVPSQRKEIHFFDRHYRAELGAYRAYFPRRTELAARSRDAFTADVTPAYLLFPDIARQMAAMLPEARLLVLLRDPSRRAVSHYHKLVRDERESLPLEVCIQRALEGETREPPPPVAYTSILARGRYIEQLLRFEAVFPREQLMVVCSEHYHAEPQKWLDRIADFFGISRWQPDPTTRSFNRSYGEPGADVLERLDAYFAPHNQALFEHLGEVLPWGRNV